MGRQRDRQGPPQRSRVEQLVANAAKGVGDRPARAPHEAGVQPGHHADAAAGRAAGGVGLRAAEALSRPLSAPGPVPDGCPDRRGPVPGHGAEGPVLDPQQRAGGAVGAVGRLRAAETVLSPHAAVGSGRVQRRGDLGPDEPVHQRHAMRGLGRGKPLRPHGVRAAEDAGLPDAGGVDFLAAAVAVAGHCPPGRPGHPLAGQDAEAGQSPRHGRNGPALQHPRGDLPRHQDRQGLHQRTAAAPALSRPQQGRL